MKVGLLVGSLILLLLAACGPADTAPTDTSGMSAAPTQVGLLGDNTRTPEEVPGAVLDMLPRYPRAEEPSPETETGFTPSPLVSVCHGEQCPKVHTASQQWAIEATEEEIEAWYWGQLVSQGYRGADRGYGMSGGKPHSHIVFFHPAQPDVNVQLHFYPQGDGVTVLDVLVVYLEPLPKPDGPVIPLGVERVEIDYLPNDTTHVISESASVQRLAAIVNGLPVRPDYIQFGSIGLEESGATLTFVSAEGESWKVRIVHPGRPFRVEFETYPHMHDTRQLLWEAVEEVIGEKEPYEAGPWPGRPAMPTMLPRSTPTAAPPASSQAISCNPESTGVPCDGGVEVGQEYPYRLYTHCGIRSAYFNGQWWIADPVLEDNYNSPRGWGNPFDAGTMRMTQQNRLLYRSSGGHAAEFRALVPGEEYQPYPCY